MFPALLEVSVAKQKSTAASGRKDIFIRCVSAKSLCSLSEHPLKSWGREEQLTRRMKEGPLKSSFILSSLPLLT